MAQRMMYPTNQQAYLPLAVQYQPQYDPAFTQMMAQNLQQTQQRHDVVNAQIAEDMARRGEMFSYDPERQQEVLGAYREDLDKIAKDYGFNYAQAASKLVSRIGEEALNPFYNLNKYKVQEAERAAQLRAQFGPEAIILNDPMATPITSGSKVEDFRADIIRASDYATVADRLGKDLKGTLTALGLSENEKFKSMLQYGSVERLTPTQIRALANDPDVIAAFRANAPTTALDNREGFEWTQSDEGIANFLYGNWAGKAYERQNLDYRQNPEWAATGGVDVDTPMFPTGNVYDSEFGVEMINTRRREIDAKYDKLLPEVTSPWTAAQVAGDLYMVGNPRTEKDYRKAQEKADKAVKEFRKNNPLFGQLEELGFETRDVIEFMRQEELRYNSFLNTTVAFHNPEAEKQLLADIGSGATGSLVYDGGKPTDNLKLLFKEDTGVLSTRVVPATGELELTFKTENNGKTGAARISPDSGFDRATRDFLNSSKEFFTSAYNINAPLYEERKLNFMGDTYLAHNILVQATDPSTGQSVTNISIMVRPEGTTVDRAVPLEFVSQQLGQNIRQSLIVNKSLVIDVPKFKANIWNRN